MLFRSGVTAWVIPLSRPAHVMLGPHTRRHGGNTARDRSALLVRSGTTLTSRLGTNDTYSRLVPWAPHSAGNDLKQPGRVAIHSDALNAARRRFHAVAWGPPLATAKVPDEHDASYQVQGWPPRATRVPSGPAPRSGAPTLRSSWYREGDLNPHGLAPCGF